MNYMHTPSRQQIDTALVPVAAALITLHYPRQDETISIKDIAAVFSVMRSLFAITNPKITPVFTAQLLMLTELGYGDELITPAHYEQAKEQMPKVASANPASN